MVMNLSRLRLCEVLNPCYSNVCHLIPFLQPLPKYDEPPQKKKISHMKISRVNFISVIYLLYCSFFSLFACYIVVFEITMYLYLIPTGPKSFTELQNFLT